MTDPSLVRVTPEKPALQPERVRQDFEDGFVSERIPASGSPEMTSKEGLFNETIFWYASFSSPGVRSQSSSSLPLPHGTKGVRI